VPGIQGYYFDSDRNSVKQINESVEKMPTALLTGPYRLYFHSYDYAIIWRD
jgi:hypothetical protein